MTVSQVAADPVIVVLIDYTHLVGCQPDRLVLI